MPLWYVKIANTTSYTMTNKELLKQELNYYVDCVVSQSKKLLLLESKIDVSDSILLIKEIKKTKAIINKYRFKINQIIDNRL